jgi:ABC-type transport system involved in cytochrome bd biosynthesis fused ATPase/permease subunit
MVDAGKKAINWFNWVNWLWLSVPASIVLLHNYWDIVDRHLLNYDWFASRRIISQKVDVTAKAPKVERKALNSKLAPLISTASGQYYVIVGPRGSGKSTSVEQACQGIEGVARIRGEQRQCL